MIWPDWTPTTWVGQRRPRGSGHCSTAAGCRKGRRDCVDTPVRAWCARRKSAELGVLWNRRPNRIARHLAVRHLAIPHLTVPHPTARHLVVYSLTVSKQGKARRMRRPHPWSPYLHRRSTAMGVPGVLDAGEPVRRSSPQLRGHQFRNPHPCGCAARQRGRAGPSFPQCPGVGRTGLGLHGRRGTSHRAVSARLMPSIRANVLIRMP